jgi:exopolyphosphatase/guanosine-5'-triphosphate,3'-diphosphate pyrophosphatase
MSPRQQRFAAIDIGTNTALLLIGEVHNGAITSTIADAHSIPRLGEGVYINGVIHQRPLQRTVEVLRNYAIQIQGASVHSAVAVATAAVRNADNRDAVQQRLQEALGMNTPLFVIDGSTEAELTFRGVAGTNRHAAVIDIGGGSTEIVWHSHGQLERTSLEVGAVRLTEHWLTGRIPHGAVIIDCTIHIPDAKEWIGVAGTPVALAMLDMGMKAYDVAAVEGYTLTTDRVRYWSEVLLAKTLTADQASAIPPERLDILPAGAAILHTIMRNMHVPQITVSTRGLRHGVLLGLANGNLPFTR